MILFVICKKYTCIMLMLLLNSHIIHYTNLLANHLDLIISYNYSSTKKSPINTEPAISIAILY